MLAGASGWTSSSVLPSPSTTSNREEWRSSLAQPRSPPTSSLHALLLHERSGVEVLVSPNAVAGEASEAGQWKWEAYKESTP
jgi:hypothetical protein